MKQFLLTNEQTGSLCTALEHLIHAGIGAADALTLLARDERDASCREMLTRMAQRVDDGASLATAIAESGSFAPYVSTLLQVGECSGKQEQTLHALAAYYNGRARLERQLRAALLYPAMLLAVLFAVLVVLLVWVLPVFNDVYAQLGSSLTGFAGGLLAFGALLRKALPVLCAVLGVAAIALLIPPLRYKLVMLWQQGLGDRGVHKKILSARFVQALSLGLSSGMTAREAVLLAAQLSEGESAAFQRRCEKCLAMAEEGAGLSDALSDCDFLGPADRRLLDAGVRSGRQEQVMEDLADKLLEQGEEALQQQAGRIEPALVAVACLLIGAVLLSVMLPLMHIMTAIG